MLFPVIYPTNPENEKDAKTARIANSIAEHWWKGTPFKSSLGELKGPFNFLYGGKKIELRSSRKIPKGTLVFQNRSDIIILDDIEEDKKMYQEVKIEKVSNGFIIKVGCLTLVSTSWKEISKGLEEYWEDPEKAEEKFKKKHKLYPYSGRGAMKDLMETEGLGKIPERIKQT